MSSALENFAKIIQSNLDKSLDAFIKGDVYKPEKLDESLADGFLSEIDANAADILSELKKKGKTDLDKCARMAEQDAVLSNAYNKIKKRKKTHIERLAAALSVKKASSYDGSNITIKIAKVGESL